jgi:1,4-dihydroxy-6-naphthoate synthase
MWIRHTVHPNLLEGKPIVNIQILAAGARGDFAAGLIIHESRFTYAEHGLECYVDLGEWWETMTGLPIPLGAIMARRSLGTEVVGAVERCIRRSVERAMAEPAASREYVARHAQEIRAEVREQHIRLYVNDFTRDLGEEGMAAVRELLARAGEAGLTTSTPR